MIKMLQLFYDKNIRQTLANHVTCKTIPSQQHLVSGKMPPGKKSPAKMSPRKLPPGNKPSKKIAPQENCPPENCPPGKLFR